MFCPKCATPNLDGASFCRSCGANISLIPQAMTGQMIKAPEEAVEEGKRKNRKEVTLDQSFKNIFMGVAFLLVSIALSRSVMGQGWWFWMLLPAFSMMGTGVAQYIRIKEREKNAAFVAPPVTRTFQEHPRNPDELMPPAASVTEGTTRHLGVEAPTRHFDSQDSK
jgi:zinc-ribbon domain